MDIDQRGGDSAGAPSPGRLYDEYDRPSSCYWPATIHFDNPHRLPTSPALDDRICRFLAIDTTGNEDVRSKAERPSGTRCNAGTAQKIRQPRGRA